MGNMSHGVSPRHTEADLLFARRVREARENAGMSQSDLAELMKRAGHQRWHQTTVSKLESGATLAYVGEAADLARILGLDLAAALYGAGSPQEERSAREQRAAASQRIARADARLRQALADAETRRQELSAALDESTRLSREEDA